MYSLGHGVPAQELENMLHEVGIDEDQDGSINEDDFLEFIRRCLVANLPSSRVAHPTTPTPHRVCFQLMMWERSVEISL